MDHFTPISIKTHTSHAVPVILYDSRQQGEKSGLSYSEINGEKSGVLLASGRDFFNKLLQKDKEAV
jgi:2,3-bisphosphoglycerate-independent phosphoglycerate mutase